MAVRIVGVERLAAELIAVEASHRADLADHVPMEDRAARVLAADHFPV
jgi:hypothetical protein